MIISLLHKHIMKKVAIIEDGLFIADVKKAVSLWRYILQMGGLNI